MKMKKRVLNTVLLFAICFCAFWMTSTKVQAADPKYTPMRKTILVCTNHSWGGSVQNLDNGKIISVKSSKPKVLSVSFQKGSNSLSYSGLKAGKSVITVKVKKGGKTYTLKSTVRVVADKPFKYIKYNNKNIYKNNEYRSNFQHGLKSGKKLTWKMKKGYKVTKAQYVISGSGSSYKKVKNGQKMKIVKNKTTWVSYEIKTPKGYKVEYRVLLNR